MNKKYTRSIPLQDSEDPLTIIAYQNVLWSNATFAAYMRTGHIITQAYLNRFNLVEYPPYLTCDMEDAIIEHILLYCESGNAARDRLKTKMSTTHTEFANILTKSRYWAMTEEVYRRY